MIVGIVGLIGSGKDTLAQMLIEEKGGVKDSFAASLKDMTAQVFGWKRHLLEGDTKESREFREKVDEFWAQKLEIVNFTPRLALQLIGTEVMRNNLHDSIWLSTFERRMMDRKEEDLVVISDARFPNELDMIKRLGGVLVWVKRGEVPEWFHYAACANQGSKESAQIMRDEFPEVHASEYSWAGYDDIDVTVSNNGTLEDLRQEANKVLDLIEKKVHN